MKNKTSSTLFTLRTGGIARGAWTTVAILSLASVASAANLVAQWDMNEVSGTTLTSTFPTGPGTESELLSNAGATWSGEAGGSTGSTNFLNFDGTTGAGGNTLDTNVSGAGLAATPSQSTLVAWFKTSGPAVASTSQGIVSYTPAGGSGAGQDLRFLLDGSGNLRAEVSSGFFINNTIDFNDGNWHMAAAIFDTNTNTSHFYADGNWLTSTSSANRAIATSGVAGVSGTNPSVDIVIGAIHNGSPFKGGIDMVKVYDGALNETELDALYSPIPEPSLLLLLGTGILVLVFRRRCCA